jgi:hypothetical protein
MGPAALSLPTSCPPALEGGGGGGTADGAPAANAPGFPAALGAMGDPAFGSRPFLDGGVASGAGLDAAVTAESAALLSVGGGVTAADIGLAVGAAGPGCAWTVDSIFCAG